MLTPLSLLILAQTLTPVPTPDPWFDTYQLDARTYAIRESRQVERVISYLILGDKRALLFDTGFGIGRIDKVVASLTKLPVTVLNSHNHYDHMGGNSAFKDILAIDHDFARGKALGMSNQSASRFIAPGEFTPPLPAGVTAQTYEIKPYTPTRLIRDNEIIDLGNRKLQIIFTPGHSPDSLCLHDPATKTLFTGDTFYPGTLWLWSPETDLQAYRKSLEKLTRLVPQLSRLLTAHGTPQADPKILPKVLTALDEIATGQPKFELRDNRRRYQFDGFAILLR